MHDENKAATPCRGGRIRCCVTHGVFAAAAASLPQRKHSFTRSFSPRFALPSSDPFLPYRPHSVDARLSRVTAVLDTLFLFSVNWLPITYLCRTCCHGVLSSSARTLPNAQHIPWSRRQRARWPSEDQVAGIEYLPRRAGRHSTEKPKRREHAHALSQTTEIRVRDIIFWFLRGCENRASQTTFSPWKVQAAPAP